MSQRRLDARLFTTTFQKYRTAKASGKRYIVFLGGSNSSKSFSAHQAECLDHLTAKSDVLMLRKNSVDLKESCYKLVKGNYSQWGLADKFAFTFSGDNRAVTHRTTGHKFLFRGANNIEQLKSLAGFSRAIMEEADQFEFTDFLEIDRRVRHPTEKVQIILILNPVSEDHWIKTKLIDGEGYKDQVEVVHCTYHDNQYASQEDIARLEALKDTSEYDYEVYVLGKWGQVRTGKEYMHNFSYVKQVKPCPFIPGQPVHLTWDFNVNPYLTLCCYQIVPRTEGGYRVQQFDEICLEHPRNRIESVAEEYLARYWTPYPNNRSYAFLYGDAQGNNRVEGKGDERRFDWVNDALKPVLHNTSNRTMRHNPSVIRQRDFMNNLLSGNKYPLDWVIDPRCKNTIIDYQKLKQGPVGFLIEKGTDAAGSSYEKYGHCYTASSYFAIGAFASWFETDMTRK